MLGGKLRGIILERSRGFFRIRFGNSSLRCLLEGVEVCCREERHVKVVKSWEGEGRKFRLERYANEAGRYILCFVHDLEEKRFSLVFPEVRGILGGWVLLGDKLRSLGIVTPIEDKVGFGTACVKEGRRDEVQVEEKEKKQSFVEVAKAKARRIGDVVWLQLGGRVLRSRDEQLGRCLVGQWGEVMVQFPDLAWLRR